jgi:hypothetical protein
MEPRGIDVTGAADRLNHPNYGTLRPHNQGLAGRIAGVQVNTNSGGQADKPMLYSWFQFNQHSNNPLYVVDGVILPVGTQSQNSNSITS